jgi:hypothetical protein
MVKYALNDFLFLSLLLVQLLSAISEDLVRIAKYFINILAFSGRFLSNNLYVTNDNMIKRVF